MPKQKKQEIKTRSLAITHPELAKEWDYEKNYPLTPKDVTAGSNKKVWWKLHYYDKDKGKYFDFKWQAIIAGRIRWNGCPYLSGQAVWPGFNDLATVNPDLASEWHPTKNGNLRPEDVTAHSGLKVWWYLPYDDASNGKHFDFEWETTIVSRSAGNGCPYLSAPPKVWKGFNDLATTHPQLAKEWNYKKNYPLTPEDVTAHSGLKVWWNVPYDDPKTGKHFKFEWEATIDNRTRWNGCPYLSIHPKVWKGFNDLATTNPELAKEWHPFKNGILKPTNVTANSSKKVWWYLPYDEVSTSKHFDFEWEASIADRNSGRGCPFLSGKRVWKGFNDLKTTHPSVAAEWDDYRNGLLKQTDLTSGSHKKVWWKCGRCGYNWQAFVYSRTKDNGTGCPKCAKNNDDK